MTVMHAQHPYVLQCSIQNSPGIRQIGEFREP